MSRHGYTLIELALVVIMLATIVDIGGGILAAMRQHVPNPTAPPPELLDMAADRLREDARGGAAIDHGLLVAGGHRWSLHGRALQRDGVARCQVQRAAWSEQGRHIAVDLAGVQGPPLRIELARGPGAHP